MPNTEEFCPQSYNLQSVSRSLPPAKGLYHIPEPLQEFTTNRPSASVVCNLSYSNLSFEHPKYRAAWLQVPGRNLRLYVLGLSFNRIEAPSWAAFVPLLEWLRPYVCHMDFAGNHLPTIIELDLLGSCKKDVKLSIPGIPLFCGMPMQKPTGWLHAIDMVWAQPVTTCLSLGR